MNLTIHDKFSFIMNSSKSLGKRKPFSVYFSPKDLLNSLIIDIRSIVCQRFLKISSIKGSKITPLKVTDTSTSSLCVRKRGWWDNEWMINFTFVGNAVTKLSFTDSTNDFPAWENRLLKPLKMKNTATNEYLSEDKFKTNAKCKSPRYKTTTTNYSWRLNIQ